MSRSKTKKQRKKYIDKKISKNIDKICCIKLCKHFTYKFGKRKWVGYCRLYNKHLNNFTKSHYKKCDECLTWVLVL